MTVKIKRKYEGIFISPHTHTHFTYISTVLEIPLHNFLMYVMT